MSPKQESLASVSETSTLQPQQQQQQQQQQPRLRRLASKPLKLAASTFRPLTRTSSPHPSVSADTVSIASTNDASSIRKLSVRRRRRHQHLDNVNSTAALTPAQIAIAARGPRKPLDGEEPAAWIRVRVVKAEGLVAKDRSGMSDPFITLVLPPATRSSTPVVKKSLNPTFPANGSTFDFPLYLSLAGMVGGRGLEGVIWDKDLMRKEYMGEFSVPMDEWFPKDDPQLWSDSLPLLTQGVLSTRRRHKVTGTVSLQIGFLPPKEAAFTEETLRKVRTIYSAFVERGNVGKGEVGLLGVPAHEGIGTIKMRSRPAPLAPAAASVQEHGAMALLHSAAAAIISPSSGSTLVQNDEDDEDDEDLLADDGLSSSSSDEDEFEDALDEELGALQISESPGDSETLVERTYAASTSGVPAPKEPPKTAGLLQPKPVPKTPNRQSSLPEYFDRPIRTETTSAPVSIPPTPGAVTPGGTKRKIFNRRKSKLDQTKPTVKRSKKDFNFNAQNGSEVLGIVFVEIKSATDLPRFKSSFKIGFDMDPFVVISFGKKVFRTRVIRHSLNPTWDEKLLFHVRQHESAFTVRFTVLDWDKVSGNDLVGGCTLPLSELLADAPKPNPETGLYGKEEDGKHEMREFVLSISTEKDQPWESKHFPKLTLRAKYEPYDALRQRFWRQYIMQYDTDDTGTMSYTELTAMLDSLGSTLTTHTIGGYFETFGKNVDKDELTIDEVIQCLERETSKPRAEKEKVTGDEPVTGMHTPTVQANPTADGLEMTGPDSISSPVDARELAEYLENTKQEDEQPGNQATLDKEVPSVKVERAATSDDSTDAPIKLITPSDMETDLPSPASEIEVDGESPDERERIINIRTCPLCHRPRLSRKSEQDIVTHLAICASSDWSRVDKIVTANYVTSSQAQRKFFTRMVNKVAIGAYSLGANSANILVQDRRTGQLMEEKMAVYVRLGIRVLYKGAKSRMEGGRARRLLKSLSVKQGLKYDSPASALDIPSFIAFHNLDVSEILDPLESFKTFNEFFYRKLKPDARPVEEPGNEGRLVSCADCRMMAFESVSEATRLWIKGREFSVGRLLGPTYKDIWDKYDGGALGIFRLAPQDYHRFHSPVRGRVGKSAFIEGEYYTVNPQAVRTTLDVYGENVRKVVPIESEEFGTVMTVWIGAMMVGSILTTCKEGEIVERTEELGYFAFGGSTIVCLFEKGVLKWDEDLLQNGRAAIETLVRMGMGIGRSTRAQGKIGSKKNGIGNGNGDGGGSVGGSAGGSAGDTPSV
ncbi:phosphatidylserine decarboxylase-domain-containing protein [Naematelia encephala]|uniref:Phosphatidylserine decarboxylase proenzyme 2 n=1 Tax=Naematelia encephala TaxID=71784 RepID=A0A1Y2AN53_9TREE|nr:phosphatidylserine decarboxylase-domain-containing protein [Naematelia encephala]